MIKTPTWVWIPLLLVLVITAMVDYYTDWTIRFTFFYGAVIAGTTILKSKRWGLFLVLVCSAYYATDRLMAGRPMELTAWNTLMEFGAYLLAWLPLYLVISIFGLDEQTLRKPQSR